MRLTMNPGVDVHVTGVLPQSRASCSAAARVAAAVASPRTTSTSRMRGAGLKKCSPTTRSGRCSPAAMAVTEIDEVFRRDHRLRPDRRLDVAQHLALDLQVLGDRLQDHGAAGERGDVGHDVQPRQRLARLRAAQPAAVDVPVESFPDPADGLLRRAGRASSSRTRCPARAATSAIPAPIVPAPRTPTTSS
jgi:hypothetical protein